MADDKPMEKDGAKLALNESSESEEGSASSSNGGEKEAAGDKELDGTPKCDKDGSKNDNMSWNSLQEEEKEERKDSICYRKHLDRHNAHDNLSESGSE